MRYGLRRVLWRLSGLRRVRACGRFVRSDVDYAEVHRVEGEDGPRGTVSGLVACGSVWSCPVCSAHIRQHRVEHEVAPAVERWQEQGNTAAFAVLTLRHHRGQALTLLLGALLDVWRSMTKGRPWRDLRDRYGIVGQIRSVEITWGSANGWHPHLNVLLFLEGEKTGEDLALLEHWFYEQWSKRVAGEGLGLPTRERGVRLERAGAGAGRYAAKLQEAADTSRSAALELLRGDLKQGTGPRGLLPFELLALAGSGDGDARDLWSEYERATKGRKAIQWSRGLRDLLVVGEEVDDDEIVTEDDTTPETLLVKVDEEVWELVSAAGQDCAIREAAEYGTRDEAREAVLTVVGDVIYEARKAGRWRGGGVRVRDPVA